MKKSRLLLVIMLAVVLCIACVCGSTFSWYTRPNEQSGSSLKWDSNYSISNGEGVTMQTLASADGGKTYKEEVSSFSNTAGLAAGKCVYYRTAIMNSSTASAQSVSLFLSQLDLSDKSGGKFYLGVNGPLKTYKNYSQIGGTGSSDSTFEKTTSDTVRIYFQPNNVDSWKDDSTVIKVKCGTNDDVNNPNFGSAITMTTISGSSPKTLYADIPLSSKMIQIYANDDTEGANATPYMSLLNYCHNLSATNSYLFVLRKNTEGSYNNHNCDTSSLSNGANIANYYRTISIPQGGTFPAALTSGTDYSGKTIEYYSSNESVFTVDKSTGEITVSSGASVGATATLYTKVIGEYVSADNNSNDNDQKQVETTVTITKAPTPVSYTFANVPVVTNFKISAAPDSTNPAVEYVYWYIKNDSSSVLKYSIADIYLSL